MAVLTRGVPADQTLSLLRGDWHCGYDPYEYRVGPQCTPLATNTLHAVGLGYAAKLQDKDQVALVLLGDGATSEGDTHEALNFAAVWQAPVVFLVQNNGYAISVPLAKQTAAPTLAAKGIGYGVPALLIDGNDAAAVYAAVSEGVERAASGGGPTLIEAITYRIEAHTNADDATRYRASDEVQDWLARDPIARLDAYLRAQGLLDDAAAERLTAEAERLAKHVRDRLNADVPVDPAELFEHVYAQPTAALERQRAALLAEIAEYAAADRDGDQSDASYRKQAASKTRPARPRKASLRRPACERSAGKARRGGPRLRKPRCRQGSSRWPAALNQALADSLTADERVVVFGEDVGTLGGVFRVTDGLATRFGDKRVFDTPLAESGIVGTAIGMAMNGLVPVVEMQFDAFAYPAFEQVTSHLAKLRNRTRGRVSLPVVDPGAVRRRHRRRRAPLRLLRGLLHAHPGAARGVAGHAGRRLPPAAAGDRLPRSRRLPRAQAPLLVEGDGGADDRRPADRPGGDPPAGPRRHPDRLRRDGGHRPRGRRGRRRGGLGRRGRRPALAVAVRRRRR